MMEGEPDDVDVEMVMLRIFWWQRRTEIRDRADLVARWTMMPPDYREQVRGYAKAALGLAENTPL